MGGLSQAHAADTNGGKMIRELQYLVPGMAHYNHSSGTGPYSHGGPVGRDRWHSGQGGFTANHPVNRRAYAVLGLGPGFFAATCISPLCGFPTTTEAYSKFPCFSQLPQVLSRY